MKGKYAARAANRIAAIDDGIIADLREELVELKTQQNELRQTLHRERCDREAIVLQKVAERTAAVVARSEDEVHSLRDSHRRDMESIADQIVWYLNDLYRVLSNRLQMPFDKILLPQSTINPDDDGPSLLRVFAALAPDRVGELLERVITIDGEYIPPSFAQGRARARRRRNATRAISDVKRNQMRDDGHKKLVENMREAVKANGAET